MSLNTIPGGGKSINRLKLKWYGHCFHYGHYTKQQQCQNSVLPSKFVEHCICHSLVLILTVIVCYDIGKYYNRFSWTARISIIYLVYMLMAERWEHQNLQYVLKQCNICSTLQHTSCMSVVGYFHMARLLLKATCDWCPDEVTLPVVVSVLDTG